jgi:hypothetical protein
MGTITLQHHVPLKLRQFEVLFRPGGRFRVTFAATNCASALTSSNNSCHSPDSIAPHLGFAPDLPNGYLSTPSSLQLSAFE